MTKWIKLSILGASIVVAGLATVKKAYALLHHKDSHPDYTITLSRGNGFAVLVESVQENCTAF